MYMYLFGGVGTDLKFGAEGYKIRHIFINNLVAICQAFFLFSLILGLVLNVAIY